MQQQGNIFQQSSKPKSKKPRFKVQDNVIEQFKSIGRGVGSSVKNDLFKGMGSTATKSVLNPKQLKPREGLRKRELSPFGRERFGKQKIERPREISLFTRKEDVEIKRKIEEIRAELAAMIEELKSVDREIEKAVNTPVVDSGVYYINYLDRLKVVLTVLRKELGNSGTWLAMSQSRKKHRGYWALYKKKGTKFGLSSEHKMSRQAG